MSSIDALRDLDAAVHAGLSGLGGADVGFYTAPGANVDVEVALYLDRNVQATGMAGQVVARRDEMRIVYGDGIDLQQGGRVFIEGVTGSGIGETWSLEKQVGNDGSLSQWVVRSV